MSMIIMQNQDVFDRSDLDHNFAEIASGGSGVGGGDGAIQYADGLSFAGNSNYMYFNKALQRIGFFNPSPSYAVDIVGTLRATAFLGDGSGLTGIASGTGGVSNTGSTTIESDSDNNDVGETSFRNGGIEYLLQENDVTYKGFTGKNGCGFRDLSEVTLAEIAKIVKSTASLRAIFIYNTANDSDGGAWREKCEEKPWYQEELNTATRGAKRKFPAKVLIACKQVASGEAVTFYDMDDPLIPMWMIFTQGAGILYSTPGKISVAMLNGELCMGTIGSYGMARVNFISGKVVNLWSALYGEYYYNGNIAERNDSKGQALLGGIKPVGSACYDISMRVLPNAIIDEATGLPIPTIGMATEAGVSVLVDTGVVWDVTTIACNSVELADDRMYIGLTVQWNVNVGKIPTQDDTIGNWRDWYYEAAVGTVPALTAGITKEFAYLGNHTLAAGSLVSPTGLEVLKENISDRTAGMIRYIKTDFNTGWMPGDIKGCWLSSNDEANLVEANIVPNGDFSSGTDDWTAYQSTLANVGGQLQVTSTGANGRAFQIITTFVVGKQYIFYCTNAGTHTVAVKVDHWITENGTDVYETILAGATLEIIFTVSSTSEGIYLTDDILGAGTINLFDNVIISELDQDRSVNWKGLQVFGTIIKSAVATGAELMAYSGFSAVNYLQQPYNSDLDPGTGDMCAIAWFKCATSSNTESIMARNYNTGSAWSGAFWSISKASTNVITTLWSDDGVSTYDQIDTSIDYGDGFWHMIVVNKNDTTDIDIYIDGALVKNANLTNAGGNFDNSNAVLTIGNNGDGGAVGNNMNVALERVSMYTPTAEQIAEMYEDEKYLFQKNAQCCLTGGANANYIRGIEQDKVTKNIIVGTGVGTNVFKGLQRVDYIDTSGTPSSDSVVSVSADDGSYAIATEAEVVAAMPALNIREQLAALKREKEIETLVDVTNDVDLQGLASLTSCHIHMKETHNTVILHIRLNATTNATAISLTLPRPINEALVDSFLTVLASGANNAVSLSPPVMAQMFSGSTTQLNFYKDATGAAWTSGAVMRFSGSFIYDK